MAGCATPAEPCKLEQAGERVVVQAVQIALQIWLGLEHLLQRATSYTPPPSAQQDCFVDYTHSDWGVRMVLVDAMISLLGTLRDRGMSVQQTCHAISKAGARLLLLTVRCVRELLYSMV